MFNGGFKCDYDHQLNGLHLLFVYLKIKRILALLLD